MAKENTYRIRPAGRHLLTIGAELIQDSYAAVIELVKNAYDAGSPDVTIQFLFISAKTDQKKDAYKIVISDHGCGMTLDDIKNHWLVPSTPDKKNRRTSPNGRVMQGSKGIGRYASSILGNNFSMETITAKGEKSTLAINWNDFDKAEYLDDVPVSVKTENVREPAGTKLTIIGKLDYYSLWDKSQFDKLRFELKKLMPPTATDDFSIHLSIEGFASYQDTRETIEPFPLFEYYDYKITGSISKNGKGMLIYSSQKARNIADVQIDFDLYKESGCGNLSFDIRAYDREKEAIDALIARGLKNPAGNYMGIRETRKLLSDYNGIGVYRNGFRIRPLGNADYDWLTLNKRRVQNPSVRIGSDQIIGFVFIESEEISGLIEKSARDGLKANPAYESLIDVTTSVISKLEEKRYQYRKSAGLSRSGKDVNKQIEALYLTEDLKKGIISSLKKDGVSAAAVQNINAVFEEDDEKRTKIAQVVRDIVAIYQGQATLGKIINVILHEGRRPLSFFRNGIPNLQYWFKAIQESGNPEDYKEFLSIAERFGI